MIKGDLRDTEFLRKSCEGHNIFIHLACISNDASFALNEELSKSVNLDAFEPMVLAAKSVGIEDLFMHQQVQYMESVKKKMLERIML